MSITAFLARCTAAPLRSHRTCSWPRFSVALIAIDAVRFAAGAGAGATGGAGVLSAVAGGPLAAGGTSTGAAGAGEPGIGASWGGGVFTIGGWAAATALAAV